MIFWGKGGAQGSRRPLGWPSRPLHFSRFPPVIPRRGNSRPPPHQAEAGAAPGHSSAPALSRPLHSPFRAQARASPALSSAPGTGTALAFPRAAFSFPAACFVRNLLGWFCLFVSLICGEGGWRCSRRVAPRRRSLPAWCTACRSFSPALPAVAVVRQGRATLRPSGRLASRARPPQRGSLPASGAGLTTAARRQARPSGILYFSFARSRQTSLRSDCRSSGVAAGSATA